MKMANILTKNEYFSKDQQDAAEKTRREKFDFSDLYNFSFKFYVFFLN